MTLLPLFSQPYFFDTWRIIACNYLSISRSIFSRDSFRALDVEKSADQLAISSASSSTIRNLAI